jgi:tRNA threonylcarbamoyladenosine biosynthesis protein TsaB
MSPREIERFSTKRMNTLAIDSSTLRAAIGIEHRSGKRYGASAGAPRGHGRDLVPRLRDLLAEAGLTARDLELIGVGLGPGSYTGLRVGVTAAKTLAYVTGAALVGFDSLEAIAYSAPEDVCQISVVADAQRGLVYSADFMRPATGAPLVAARATCIEPSLAWIARLKPGVLAIGPGLDSPNIRAALPAEFLPREPARNEPNGLCLIDLALHAWNCGRRENPWLLEPRYLRGSAAEEKRDARRPARCP